MARKKKKRNNSKSKKKNSTQNTTAPIKPGTLNSVWAITLFALALLFILAGIGKAGMVGESFHTFFTYLLGAGYFLLPVIAGILAIAFIRPQEATVNALRLFSALVFFASGLGMVELIFHERGGIIGNMIATPLINLFDVIAAGIVLGALAVVALIVIFDVKLDIAMISRLRGKEQREEDLKITTEDENLQEKEKGAPEATTPEKKGFRLTGFGASSDKAEAKGDEDLAVSFSTLDGKEYVPPPISLLQNDSGKPGVGDIKANANIIKRTLQNFGIDVEMDEISIGPTVTRYALKPAEGVRLSKIVGLQNNLELAMAAHPVRIEAPIPGKSLVGIEVPNNAKTTVGLAGLLSSGSYKESKKSLLLALGKGISGKSYMADLGKAPHLLIAGATGAGKSVTIHTLIHSLIYRNAPETLKFIMIDPKRVELTLYNGIPHLLTPVITDPKKAILSLKWATKEMERRYDILEQHRVRDIESYQNNVYGPELEKYRKKAKKAAEGEGLNPPPPMPYVVIIIDELADLMQTYPREFESAIVRLAQMSRAVGIHLILSTQRPSVNVITGLIKANIPARIALQVSSQVDSRTILDGVGAEKLLGAGDMLYLSGEMSKPVRIQSAFISEKEVKSVVKYLSKQYEDELTDEVDITGKSEEASDIFEIAMDDGPEEEDELYPEARDVVIHAGKGSTSYLQRKLRVGYARAARLMDMLEEQGIVGPQDGSKAREVLVEHPDDANEEVEDEGEEETY